MIIPLDAAAPDYQHLMSHALTQLAQRRDFWSRSLYPRLAVSASDEFRFQKESKAPSGLIAWRHGERLVESARRTFLAGAKYYIGPGRHFVNRHGRFATRYLDQILMGQTAVGSYVITALAPSDASIELKQAFDGAARLPDVGVARVRSVNEAVVHAVGATVEALDHYRSSGSLAGFEQGVIGGVSYEMTNAILGITSNADEALIAVEWDQGQARPEGVESEFFFNAEDVAPLAQAAAKLAEDESSTHFSVTGRVHLLAKKTAGSPGVFGIDSLQSQGPRKVRVRLADDEDYHEAVRAHEEDLAILVAGRLEKEGNLSWLYDATVVRTLGSLDEFPTSRRSAPQEGIPGQLDMF
ncbi:hypothetical protein [Streptomyces antimicrobicus]|uniref:Uncharacterized protein n=1 Tax=Streptomyces antimicrobicus TaxID=2883108 RepID=A0ABS8AZK8_9ACTN|nr:hypothetical protein [Streptomyces antimicrobicus]MCB5177788.1 hypothetical protein [Streptomyces antimicrobicus]